MKTLLFLSLFFVAVDVSGQIDTVYSELSKVEKKKVNIIVNRVNGEELTQIKEAFNYEKALKRIEALQRDTASFENYLDQLKHQEKMLENERKRIRMLRRDAINLLEKLNALLPNLK